MGYIERNRKFPIAVMEKNYPDVCNPRFQYLPVAYDGGAVIPLDQYITDDVRARYSERLWETVTYRGKILAVPNAFGSFVLWYHKDVFRKAGLDPNNPPKTWDELIEYGKKIAENTNSYGYGYPGSRRMVGEAQLFFSIFFSISQGKQLVDKEGNLLFDSPEGIKAYKIMKRMVEEKAVQPNIVEYTRGDIREPFRDGKIAMTIDGPWILPVLQPVYDFTSPDKCGVAQALTPKPYKGAEPWGYVDQDP